MAKSSQKPAGAEQPANQRGKSRFNSSARPARVVLPERPPRAVDNEIVSILLGADPASLVEKALDAVKATPPERIESLPSPSPASEETPVASTVVSTQLLVQEEFLPKPVQSPVSDYDVKISPAVEVEEEPEVAGIEQDTALEGEFPAASPSTLESAVTSHHAPVPFPAPASPVSQAGRKARTAAHSAETQEVSISSFEEFAERWKHGLRKGQLKICEVLYQKTYAVGQTECITSFSELGRLSGLKMRQCFNVIAQLEALKFVERARSADTSNKKDQGSVIRFYLFPTQ
jgi:hypothetical protein